VHEARASVTFYSRFQVQLDVVISSGRFGHCQVYVSCIGLGELFTFKKYNNFCVGRFFLKNIHTSEKLTSYEGKILLSIFDHWAYCTVREGLIRQLGVEIV
jgi:hypothetical protein